MVLELGNIRSEHVFRARGLNSKLYHRETPEGAAADGNHLEEPAGPSCDRAFQQGIFSPRERKETRCLGSF